MESDDRCRGGHFIFAVVPLRTQANCDGLRGHIDNSAVGTPCGAQVGVRRALEGHPSPDQRDGRVGKHMLPLHLRIEGCVRL